MLSLPSDLDILCAKIFLQCAEFDSAANLRALFTTAELAPFVYNLPEKDGSKTAFVATVKYFLLTTRLRDGRALMLPFLVVLRDQYSDATALYGELDDLHERMQQLASGSKTKPEARADTSAAHEADIAILTILPEEYQAVCGKLKKLQSAPPRGDHANLYAWKVGVIKTSVSSGYTVAVGMMGRAGTTESALATRDAVTRWNPRYVFFVGVAGGLGKLKKGDVVIADVIHGYEYGKVEKTFSPRSNWTYKTDIGLLNGAVAHTPEPWQTRITAQPPQPVALKALAGEVASGDKVVDDPNSAFFAEVLKTWPKIVAVEMEGAGAGNAIEQSQALGKAVSYMMIRGISDLPPEGTTERDAWKAYAADTAAAFAASFIASGLPLPPR